MSRQIPSHRRRGFTLVEMLVVIVIILILIGLLVPAVAGALARAHETAILSEIQQLDSSLKAFKEKYGSYPPSDFTLIGTSQDTVSLFLQKAFPRCNVQAELSCILALETPAATSGAGVSTAVPLSPAQAIVFWLSGFSGDPEHPISGRVPLNVSKYGMLGNVTLPFYWAANPPDARFSFDQGRLVVIQSGGAAVPPGTAVASGTGTEGVQVFIPSTSHETPYVYFASQNYATHWLANYQFPTGGTGSFAGAWAGQGGAGAVRPYLQDNGTPGTGFQLPAPYFVNPSSFQIISAGLDDDWGAGACVYSTGAGPGTLTVGSGSSANSVQFSGYAQGDKDNLTNFSPGELIAAVPQP